MKLTIVTLCDDNRRAISDVTAPTVERFCANTGARFVRHTSLIDPSIHPNWNKYISVITAFEDNDWIMWLDSDIAIVNPTFDLSAHISSHGDKDAIFSVDFNGLCAGAFLIRNNGWCQKFLETVLYLKDVSDPIVIRNNGGHLRAAADQDCVKMLYNHWPDVKKRFGFIPESIIMNTGTKIFYPEAFAIHYWSYYADEKEIVARVNNYTKEGWSEKCVLQSFDI